MTTPTLNQWIEDLEDGDEPEQPEEVECCDCGCPFQFCTARRVAVDYEVCDGPEGDALDFAYDSRR